MNIYMRARARAVRRLTDVTLADDYGRLLSDLDGLIILPPTQRAIRARELTAVATVVLADLRSEGMAAAVASRGCTHAELATELGLNTHQVGSAIRRWVRRTAPGAR